MTPWPNTRYAIVVPTWTGEAPCGLGWRIHERGHAPLAQQVREIVARSGVTPDYLMVHCPGAGEYLRDDDKGNPVYEMAVDGFDLALNNGWKDIDITLREWPALAREWGVPTWLYLGRCESERLREMPLGSLLKRIEYPLTRAKANGFHGVFFDSSANGWTTRDADQRVLRFAIDKAREYGLQVGCEAWPQAEHEELLKGCPVWMRHTPFASSGSWATQHPLMRPGDWQAPTEGHVGMVHVIKHPSYDYQLTPELTQKITATNCIVGVNFDQWDKLGLPGRGPELKESK
jgi:hypothetical protein